MKPIKKKPWYKQDPNFLSEKKQYQNPIPSREFLRSILHDKALSLTAIAKMLSLSDSEKQAVQSRLKAMCRDGELTRINRKYIKSSQPQRKTQKPQTRLKSAKSKSYNTSTVNHTGEVSWLADYGFLLLPDAADVYIDRAFMPYLMHGDRVEVEAGFDAKGRQYVKAIVRVLKRASDELTAVVLSVDKATASGVYATIKQLKMKRTVWIEASKQAIKAGDTVHFLIKSYPKLNVANPTPLHVKIIDCLGQLSAYDAALKQITSEYSLSKVFPDAVNAEAMKLAHPSEEALDQARQDLRHLPFVTIDGEDSRDFDDAVFVKKTSKGFKLYVAIADVAHYVKPATALDKEAFERGTSVYFPNTVLPMLPEALSNDLCSLNPHVDRFALVCEMLFDSTGKLQRSSFYNAVIYSHARLTYQWVQDFLFLGKKTNTHKEVHKHLREAKQLYQLLLAQKQARGALDFDHQEPAFLFTENNDIDALFFKENLEANQLIEVFMVSANICAAKFLQKKHLAGIFRNHESPTDDKKTHFIKQLQSMGVLNLLPSRKSLQLPADEDDTLHPKQLAGFLNNIADHPQKEALQMTVLRSMCQAVYEGENKGHFGLALDDYTHFTSPIRRYPDLWVHREIKAYLEDKVGAKEKAKKKIDKQQQVAAHCSNMERQADDASYAMQAFCHCLFMQKHVGASFSGKITGIREFGLFVTLDTFRISGLVHVSHLDDYYHFDSEAETLVGERHRKIYRLGDCVDVRLHQVNVEERKIDLQLLESKTNAKPKSNQKSKQKRRCRRS